MILRVTLTQTLSIWEIGICLSNSHNKFFISFLFSVRLPIKDHNHWQDSPSELVVHDNVAELVYPKQEHTTVKTEYLTDTPYYTQGRCPMI